MESSSSGTLSYGNSSGQTKLSFKVTDPNASYTITAVPASGYEFVKWSDGVTKRTRTDTNFDQNVDVTAVFAAASIQISSSGKAALGDSYTFKATLKGKYLETSSIRWYVNGSEVTQAAGKTTIKGEVDPSMVGGTFRVYATASYNDCTVTSNKLELSVSGAPSSSSSSSSSASSKEDKPASSKDETSASSKEDKPASSKEEKPASSSSNGTSESTGSSSKVEKPASSAASSKEEKPTSSSQSSSSKVEKPASSKQEHTASSKEDEPATSKEEKPASSKTEASASKEAAN